MEPLTKRDFEVYLQDIAANPLSPLGEQWTRIEKYMTEVHDLVEHLKSQEVTSQANHKDQVKHTKDLR
jgi:hypothetical protein